MWGVMGSCPGGKSDLLEYGSNTSCITVSNSTNLVIFDAGSGLVQLGQSGIDFKKYKRIFMFITHYHYDHIIGMPFFSPFYDKDIEISIYAPKYENMNSKGVISKLFQKPFLPMTIDNLLAKINFHNIDGFENIKIGDLEVSSFRTDHPGGNFAYKVKHGSKIFSYITDLEHKDDIDSRLVEFVKNSNNIYYDSNFTDYEKHLPRYEGWGHSSHSKGIKLMIDSNSKNVYLGHHAVHRKSDELEEIDITTPDNVKLAREGMEFEL